MRFRTDIEGLRGLATLVVLAYHAQVPGLPGGYVGLDVFFVMSGFLITALLINEVRDGGRIDLGRFYARRMRRLLPAALVVLVATAILGAAILSPLERGPLAGDLLAAALYVVNWRFVQQQTDYAAAGIAASPVQQFWSLSVEEQFYVLWPLLIVASTVWLLAGSGRSRGLRLRVAAAALIVGTPLFIYSLEHTREAAGAAYFSTLSRGWEFALGALLAALPLSRVLPRALAAVLAWGGLIVLGASMVGFDEATRFPGPAALVPTLATAAIIAAGSGGASGLAQRVLSIAPLRWVGRVSYSWYLWHWPLLVYAAVLWGPLSTWGSVAVVGASMIPTVLTFHLVEQRFRRPRAGGGSTLSGLRLGLACTGAAACAAAALWVTIPTVPVASASEAIGARALAEGSTELQRSATAVRPDPRSAVRDRGQPNADGCELPHAQERSGPCIYGDPRGTDAVVLIGDSHAMQYAPALEAITRRRGQRLIVLTKSGCTPAEVAVYNSQLRRRFDECERWRRHSLQRIVAERPRLVVVGNSAAYHVMDGDAALDDHASAPLLAAGLATTLRTLHQSADRVVVMRDNPRPRSDVRGCVSRSLTDLAGCAFSPHEGYGHFPVNTRAAEQVPGTVLIDLSPVLCPQGICPAVIGNVLVYRNTNHITATYMRTLIGWLAERLPD